MTSHKSTRQEHFLNNSYSLSLKFIASAAIWLAASSFGSAIASAAACIPLTHSVPAEGLRALARGFNLDGWISNPKSAHPALSLLQVLRKAGMTHVRLPVPAEQIMERFALKPDRDDRLRAVGRALKELLSLGYYVSVDLHPGSEFNRLQQQDLDAATLEIKKAWIALAEIIKPLASDRVFAELLNEPELKANKWQVQVEEVAALVRQLLPRTTLIVGPVNWQRADSLPNFRPLNDLNVVYAIHFYDPMAFSHQGHWDSNDPLSDIQDLPYPIDARDARVAELRKRLVNSQKTAALQLLDKAIDASAGSSIAKWLEPAEAWQQRFSRPIIINEFGVLKAQAPRESRLRWLSSVVGYAEEHCWGWAHWELSQGFGLVDDKTGLPDEGVMRALLGSQ